MSEAVYAETCSYCNENLPDDSLAAIAHLLNCLLAQNQVKSA